MYVDNIRIAWINYLEMIQNADSSEAKEKGIRHEKDVTNMIFEKMPKDIQEVFPNANITGRIEDDFCDFPGWDEEVGVQEAVVWTLNFVNEPWGKMPRAIRQLSEKHREIAMRVDIRGYDDVSEHFYAIGGKMQSPGGRF